MPDDATQAADAWRDRPRHLRAGQPIRRPGPRHNLPSPLTSFVGREREVDELVRLLGRHRLVTLVGAPGVGKTRLGLAIARAAEGAFRDGAWLVELASVHVPGLVPRAVAQVLDVAAPSRRSPIAGLIEHLEHRAVLLVLDNCEHLVDSVAALVEPVLRACSEVRVLGTSREPLGVDGEVAWRVPSLSAPAAGAAWDAPGALASLTEGYEAARLFVERARVAAPGRDVTDRDAAPIARICARLDGIPLALELAAARVRGLSIEQIDARLDDRFRLLAGGGRTAPPRYRTLRGAIDWSYDLLAEPERALLSRLAVFAGGWTLEAAEAICADEPLDEGDQAAGPRAADAIDLRLLQLVDKSLVQVDAGSGAEPRYRLLEMIRQYGLERLREAGAEDAVRREHLRWYAALAERGQEGIHRADGLRWIERLAAEEDNLRAALAWGIRSGDPACVAACLTMAGALFQFWLFRDHLAEGRDWLDQALSAARALRPPDRPTSPAGGGRPPAGLPAPRTGAFGADPRVVALNELGVLLQQLGEPERGGRMAGEGLALARAVGDRLGEAHARVTLALGARAAGDHAGAADLLEAGLAIVRHLGDPFGKWRTLSQLGDTRRELGDTDGARRLLDEALAVAREMGHPWGIAQVLRQLASVVARQGGLDRAQALLEESLTWWAQIGATRGRNWSLLDLGHVVLARGDHRRARACFAESLALCRDAGDRPNVARCLASLAAASLTDPETRADAEAERAACLLGSASALRDAVGAHPPPSEEELVARATASGRARLGAARFDAARSRGLVAPLDAAIELGLGLGHAPRTGVAPAPSEQARPAGPRPDPVEALTAREAEVAALIGRGYTNRQIAEALIIGERTAETHARHIRDKLGLTSRAQVIAWAIDRGLVAGRRATP
jgi:predicted ATPase/DNA-binding CsgD family transcriptional regulator